MTSEAPPSVPPADLLFDAVLYPHRSLKPRGFWLLMAGVVAVSFCSGIAFVRIGAWPVFGYFGLDAALLFWCFRLNYRSARLYETVSLTRGELLIERVWPNGRTDRWTFQPFWLRVEMDEPARQESQLTLRSHGKALTIGRFLSPPERLDLARALRRALSQLRGVPGEAAARPAS